MKKKLLMMIMTAGISISFAACQNLSDVKQENVNTETESETQSLLGLEGIRNTENVEDTQNVSETTPESEEENSQVVNSEAEEGKYGACTSKSDEEVEAFVKEIITYFEKEDWESLADHISYPITINEKYYKNKEKFLKTDWSKTFSQNYKNSVINALPMDMFCNWQGIMLDNGLLWFIEEDNQLVVSAINYHDGTNQPDESTGVVGHWELDQSKTEEELNTYSSLMEIFGTGIHVGATLDITSEGTFEMSLALAEYNQGTYQQDENLLMLKYKDMNGTDVETDIVFENIDGKMYIISEYAGEKMYWSKLAE